MVDKLRVHQLYKVPPFVWPPLLLFCVLFYPFLTYPFQTSLPSCVEEGDKNIKLC